VQQSGEFSVAFAPTEGGTMTPHLCSLDELKILLGQLGLTAHQIVGIVEKLERQHTLEVPVSLTQDKIDLIS